MVRSLETASKDFVSLLSRPLKLLEIMWVRILIAVVIILYILGGIPNLPGWICGLFHNPFVKLAFLLLIIYVAFKDLPLGLLLALAFVLSLQFGYNYAFSTQLGATSAGLSGGVGATAGPLNLNLSAGLSNPLSRVEGMDIMGAVDGAFGAVSGAVGSVGSAVGSMGGAVGGMMGDNGAALKGGNLNRYMDCVENCDEGVLGMNPECKAVAVWSDELNAQGMNCPSGASGQRVGAPF